MSKNLLKEIRIELTKHIDKKYLETSQVFSKEKVKSLGVRTPVVRKIAKDYFAKIKDLSKEEIFKLCEQLLETGYDEDRHIAFDWAFRLRRYYAKSDFQLFESWLKKYVNSWGSCDDFCTHAFGEFILLFPEFLPKLKTWARSKNRWLRRASAVILIYPNRHENFLPEIFRIADILLLDKDDLVQKGYGWMLKEASKQYEKEVFDYVMRHKEVMPRTALRYALEKMPKGMKQKAMKVNS